MISIKETIEYFKNASSGPKYFYLGIAMTGLGSILATGSIMNEIGVQTKNYVDKVTSLNRSIETWQHVKSKYGFASDENSIDSALAAKYTSYDFQKFIAAMDSVDKKVEDKIKERDGIVRYYQNVGPAFWPLEALNSENTTTRVMFWSSMMLILSGLSMADIGFKKDMEETNNT